MVKSDLSKWMKKCPAKVGRVYKHKKSETLICPADPKHKKSFMMWCIRCKKLMTTSTWSKHSNPSSETNCCPYLDDTPKRIACDSKKAWASGDDTDPSGECFFFILLPKRVEICIHVHLCVFYAYMHVLCVFSPTVHILCTYAYFMRIYSYYMNIYIFDAYFHQLCTFCAHIHILCVYIHII